MHIHIIYVTEKYVQYHGRFIVYRVYRIIADHDLKVGSPFDVHHVLTMCAMAIHGDSPATLGKILGNHPHQMYN